MEVVCPRARMEWYRQSRTNLVGICVGWERAPQLPVSARTVVAALKGITSNQGFPLKGHDAIPAVVNEIVKHSRSIWSKSQREMPLANEKQQRERVVSAQLVYRSKQGRCGLSQLKPLPPRT